MWQDLVRLEISVDTGIYLLMLQGFAPADAFQVCVMPDRQGSGWEWLLVVVVEGDICERVNADVAPYGRRGPHTP